MKIDDNIEININEVINYIKKEKFVQVEKYFNLTYEDEIYRIEIIESGKIYLLEELFV